MSVVHMVCGGESPETRHSRVETEKMDWEAQEVRRERFSEKAHFFMTEEERIIDRLETVNRSFHHSLLSQKDQIRNLEAEVARLNQILWGITA
jgi:predicted RNase H-like nuclease (RuvC/YqgF family)